MATYRKKPVEIEAVQWDGNVLVGGAPEWIAAVGEDLDQAPATVADGHVAFHGEHLFIGTREGTMCASPGDWIICGVAGEIYPCKPEIFAATYEGPITIGRTELGAGEPA
jgi:hypothetical protein